VSPDSADQNWMILKFVFVFRRFGAEQPLFDWMESRDYEGNFVSAEWLEKAKLEPEDRYRMSEHLHEFVQH